MDTAIGIQEKIVKRVTKQMLNDLGMVITRVVHIEQLIMIYMTIHNLRIYFGVQSSCYHKDVLDMT